jgi:hypothetical protein
MGRGFDIWFHGSQAENHHRWLSPGQGRGRFSIHGPRKSNHSFVSKKKNQITQNFPHALLKREDYCHHHLMTENGKANGA